MGRTAQGLAVVLSRHFHLYDELNWNVWTALLIACGQQRITTFNERNEPSPGCSSPLVDSSAPPESKETESLTPRGPMCLLDLPPEILSHICSHLSLRDLLVVCHVARAPSECASRILYRKITVLSLSSFRLLLRTLPRRGHLVRSLCFGCEALRTAVTPTVPADELPSVRPKRSRDVRELMSVLLNVLTVTSQNSEMKLRANEVRSPGQALGAGLNGSPTSSQSPSRPDTTAIQLTEALFGALGSPTSPSPVSLSPTQTDGTLLPALCSPLFLQLARLCPNLERISESLDPCGTSSTRPTSGSLSPTEPNTTPSSPPSGSPPSLRTLASLSRPVSAKLLTQLTLTHLMAISKRLVELERRIGVRGERLPDVLSKALATVDVYGGAGIPREAWERCKAAVIIEVRRYLGLLSTSLSLEMQYQTLASQRLLDAYCTVYFKVRAISEVLRQIRWSETLLHQWLALVVPATGEPRVAPIAEPDPVPAHFVRILRAALVLFSRDTTTFDASPSLAFRAFLSGTDGLINLFSTRPQPGTPWGAQFATVNSESVELAETELGCENGCDDLAGIPFAEVRRQADEMAVLGKFVACVVAWQKACMLMDFSRTTKPITFPPPITMAPSTNSSSSNYAYTSLVSQQHMATLERFKNESLSKLRPWGNRFSKPISWSQTSARVSVNLVYYQTNYLLVVAGLLIYALVTNFHVHPSETPPIELLLLFTIVFILAAAYFAVRMPQDQPTAVTILGRPIVLTQQQAWIGLALISIPLLWISSAGSAIFWLLGAASIVVGSHAALLEPPIETDFNPPV
ncbi:hypothetical protein M427DRAFT_30416 [Gonapodya prolifera JEL478]|uniref:F-box domain-containing protein n=1 Tax=Gonapodya prolifera (strain JEL478) TaxID=1344416 RepID=A0A139ALJ5_GONPJ|nr:hypothetical protein M427DRAFT_30416 [Gonapodya prolifera JEL478]|eukprot:KXS17630.1 hypothetical protein M427DRAFT_30416 [Gonapodya prolifera JEL478]